MKKLKKLTINFDISIEQNSSTGLISDMEGCVESAVNFLIKETIEAAIKSSKFKTNCSVTSIVNQ